MMIFIVGLLQHDINHMAFISLNRLISVANTTQVLWHRLYNSQCYQGGIL